MGRPRLRGMDRRVSKGAWLAVLVAGLSVWVVPALATGITTTYNDWQIYREAAALWQSTGSPYAMPPASWDPDLYHPYLYPPTSWLFLAIVDIASPGLLALGLLPFLAVSPRRWASPFVATLLFVAAVPTILLGNVNALIAGSLVVAFLPGVAGGFGFAVAVALKGYPLVLVPLLWHDRRRILIAAIVLGTLAVSGTLIWGPDSWASWLAGLATEGRYVDSINPLSDNRAAGLVAAACALIVGLVIGSPGLVLAASLFASPAVYVHYLLTIAAGLVSEPPIRMRARRWPIGRHRRPEPEGPAQKRPP